MTPAIDYSISATANLDAMAVAENLADRLGDSTVYAGLRIVPSGIELYWAGPATGAVLDAVMLATKVSPGPVPVVVKRVNNSQAELNELTARIAADAGSWRTLGIDLARWGPDTDTNLVSVHLRKPNTNAQKMLRGAYGTLVTVAAEIESWRALVQRDEGGHCGSGTWVEP